MNVYPVQQTVLQTGALASLSPILGSDKASPIPLKTGEDPFTSFRVAGEQVSIAVAAKLDVSAVFSGSFKYSDIGLVFDAVAYTDKYLEDGNDQPVVMTRWGAGMRVAMKVTGYESGLSVNFGAIAAAVELNRARVSYEILGLGLGIDALALILDDLPALGNFDLEAYAKLTEGVYAALKTYISTHRDKLTAVPIAVGLKDNIGGDPLQAARSVYLAAYWRDRSKSREWILQEYPEIDSGLVDIVFELSNDEVERWLKR